MTYGYARDSTDGQSVDAQVRESRARGPAGSSAKASGATAGAGFRSLLDAWADTTTPHRLLMLTFLGGLAEFERELIRRPHRRGPRARQRRGVHMGRPPKLTPRQKKEALPRTAPRRSDRAAKARAAGRVEVEEKAQRSSPIRINKERPRNLGVAFPLQLTPKAELGVAFALQLTPDAAIVHARLGFGKNILARLQIGNRGRAFLRRNRFSSSQSRRPSGAGC